MVFPLPNNFLTWSFLTWKRMVDITSLGMPHFTDVLGWKSHSGFTFGWNIYIPTLSSTQYYASQLNLLCFEKIVYCATQRIQIQNCEWHLLAWKCVQTTSACSLENLGRKTVLESCDQVGLMVRRPFFLYIRYIQRIFRLFFWKLYWSLLLKKQLPTLLSLVSSVPPSLSTIY